MQGTLIVVDDLPRPPHATDRTAWHPDDAVGWTVVRLAHLLGRQFDHALKQLALTPRQFGVLATIAAEPGINSGQLARKVLVTAQSMGELVTGLEKAGYLTRDHDRGRGRRLDMHLTPAGHDVLTRAFGVVAGLNAPHALGLSHQETAQLNTLLHKALTHLQP